MSASIQPCGIVVGLLAGLLGSVWYTWISWKSVYPSLSLSEAFGFVSDVSTSSPSEIPSPSVSGFSGSVPYTNFSRPFDIRSLSESISWRDTMNILMKALFIFLLFTKGCTALFLPASAQQTRVFPEVWMSCSAIAHPLAVARESSGPRSLKNISRVSPGAPVQSISRVTSSCAALKTMSTMDGVLAFTLKIF